MPSFLLYLNYFYSVSNLSIHSTDHDPSGGASQWHSLVPRGQRAATVAGLVWRTRAVETGKHLFIGEDLKVS